MTVRPGERRAARALLAPGAIWFGVLFVAPLIIMIVYAFARREGFSTYVFGMHGENFRALADPVYAKVLRTTFGLALGTTLGTLVIGYPFAYWIATRVRARRALVLLFVIVPFWTSLLVRTYAWILLLAEGGPLSSALQRLGVIGEPLGVLYTPRAVLIGLVYDYVPLMVFPLYVSIERMDRSLAEASRDLGAGRWATFRRITLPLTMPGVVAGSVLVFVPAMGEYVVPALLGGARTFTMGNVVADQFLAASNWPFGAAMALVMLGAMLVLILAYVRLAGRETEHLGAPM